ncbi:MAG TPA: YggS family pyridoxal phosphate enzyme [Dermatophilaceae bacterium]|nr:YggS family pyridoxal phosphate enzyme [Dermatophilaceae bacterium]
MSAGGGGAPEVEGGRRAELAGRLAAVHHRIAAARTAAGRHDEVTLVVVTKFFPASDVDLLAELGVRHVGENRDQEASAKFEEVGRRGDLTVHFIGQLQTNKAQSVLRYADVVQSVDRPRLVGALDRAAGAGGRTLDVTVQVDLTEAVGLADAGAAGRAGGPSGAPRGGAAPGEASALADLVAAAAGLRLRGVMAVAPLGADPAAAFDALAGVHERLLRDHPDATWRSAGMSGDLEPAIACGATHLRVGTAILGSRPSRR